MKRPYEKPVLVRREVLSRIVAAVASPGDGQGQGQLP